MALREIQEGWGTVLYIPCTILPHLSHEVGDGCDEVVVLVGCRVGGEG